MVGGLIGGTDLVKFNGFVGGRSYHELDLLLEDVMRRA